MTNFVSAVLEDITLNYPSDGAIDVSLNPALSVGVSGSSSAYNLTFFEHIHVLPDEYNYTLTGGGFGVCNESDVIRGLSYAHDGDWDTDVYVDCHITGVGANMLISENYTGITDDYVIYWSKLRNPSGAVGGIDTGLFLWNYTKGDFDAFFYLYPHILYFGNITIENPSDYIQGGKLITKIRLRLSYGSDRYFESSISRELVTRFDVLNNSNAIYGWSGLAYGTTYEWSVLSLNDATVSPFWNFTTYATMPETGLDGLLSGAGTGLGGFLTGITDPVVDIILALGLISGVLVVIYGVMVAMTQLFKGAVK